MRRLVIPLLLLLCLTLVACGRGRLPVQVEPEVTFVSLTVKVVDGSSNQPVPGARISLKKDSQNVAPDQVTDGSGQVIFNKIPTADGYKAFANQVTGFSPSATPSIQLVENTEVLIPLTRSTNVGAGLVAGSVKDARTQLPLKGVTVSLQVATPSPVQPAMNTAMAFSQRGWQIQQWQQAPAHIRVMNGSQGPSSVQTDQAGQFTFENVPAAAYQLTFSLNLYKKEVREAMIQDGNSTTVETVFLKQERAPGSAGHAIIVEAGRAIELDQTGAIVWSFNSQAMAAAARLRDGGTVIADEMENKVWVVSPKGKVIWNMGSGWDWLSKLKIPSWVAASNEGESFLITDTGNNRILEIAGGRVAWQYNTHLSRPRSATYTPEGTIMIADTGNQRLVEVNRQGQVVWAFLNKVQDQHPIMLAPAHAIKTEDGTVLITDSGYNRVIKVAPLAEKNTPPNTLAAQRNTFRRLNQTTDSPSPSSGQVVWYYDEGLDRPRSAYPSATGNIMIVDTGNGRIIEVDRTKKIVHKVDNLRLPRSVERL